MSLAHAVISTERRLRVVTPFGPFQADVRDLVSFPQGLPGFEQCRQFAVLSRGTNGPLQCLHAVDGRRPSFLVINPYAALASFRSVLSESDRLRLSATDDTPLLWLAIVTIVAGEATVNLRAPIVINPARMIGYQVLPNDSVYPLAYPLSLA